MSLEEQVEKCSKIHDILAEFWNWAYYNTPHRKCSWLLAEYVERLKPDVEHRVPLMLQEVEELLKQNPNDSFAILDVGCGVGGFLHRVITSLAAEYPATEFKATGIDISTEMIDCALNNLRDLDVELVRDDITNHDLTFRHEPFDVAVLMVTLSFYNDKNAKEILAAIHDRLKREGCLLVMDFAWSYKWGGFTLFSKPLQRLTDMFFSHLIGESFHFANRTEEQLNQLLDETGFEVASSYLSEKKSRMKGMLVMVTKKVQAEKRLAAPLTAPTSR